MDPAESRANNFGVVRLILAALVIVSHSPELLDGNRSREIATSIWHTLSFGEIGVDGFFVVSGYLITQSFVNSADTWSYFRKRLLRIYPAFVVASAVCIFVVAPLGGGAPPPLISSVVRVLALQPPLIDGVFAGLPYPVVNGAMWSIAIEFRCYLLVLVLGSFGLLRWRAAILATGIGFLLLTGFRLVPPLFVPGDDLGILGFLPLDIRMVGAFMIGMSFYLYRERLPLTSAAAMASVLTCMLLMFIAPLAELALCTLGGYALFWFILKGPVLAVARRTDISYGLYLYAWPVGSLLIWYLGRDLSPWLLAVLTILIAGMLGAASWFLVEQPALRLKRSQGRLAVAGKS
jgi:peptidoglycan/LPS O-acetylase OafA/YrhL